MANLIQNPGFEIVEGNDFFAWTEIIPGVTVFDNTTNPHNGLHAAQLGLLQPPLPPIAAGSISQTFTGLTPGNTYTLSFYAASYDLVGVLSVAVTSVLSVPWLNASVNVNLLTGVNGYTLYTYQFVALDTDAILTFANAGLSVVLIDDVGVTLAAICYSGESLVYTKNTQTGEIGYIEAKNVYSKVHEVFSVDENKFVPVKLNVVSGPINQYRLIKKDVLGTDKPNADFYITSGHKIVVDGEMIKAGKLPFAKRYKLKNPEKVYSICVDGYKAILVNNLPVMAWDCNKWLNRVSKTVIEWHDNVPADKNVNKSLQLLE